MNYHTHYQLLMDRAKDRTLSGYSERHRIVPGCLGGTYAKENVVRLTPEEHYVAHLLLVKLYPGNHRLLWAAMCMTGGNKKQQRSNNKVYGWLRRRFAEAIGRKNQGRKHTPEAKANMAAGQRRRKEAGRTKPHSAETKAKMSAASRGRPKSEAHRAALSAAKLGKRRKSHSEK